MKGSFDIQGWGPTNVDPKRSGRSRKPGLVLGCAIAIGLGIGVVSSQAQELLDQFEDRVTTFSLENGLRLVVVERPAAPVISFHTYADVGSVDEPIGETGVAHMFEHMAFKGTESIGTRNYAKEREAIRRQEAIYQRLVRARATLGEENDDRIAELEAKFEKATKEVEKWSQSEEFEEILRQAGVTGLNAYTMADGTGYMYSLPANKVELFFAMESDRFLNPVLREFYTERQVVMEERRQRVESSPIGGLVEEWQAAAYLAHPYGQPTIGHMSDLRNISRTEAREFFAKYYPASNLTIGIVGAVEPDRVRDLAEEYFGRLPRREPPLPVTTEEPSQRGERRVVLHGSAQPYLLIGYHRPSQRSSDHAVFTVLADILSRGRTSRFHQQLVETKLALQANAFANYPGEKYPSLFGVIGVPNKGVAPQKLEGAVLDELDRIKEEAVSSEALKRAKIRARADLIGGLDSNSGLAQQLSTYEGLTGDWRNLFRHLEEVQSVTAEDVQRVAKETFVRENRTVAILDHQSESTDAGASKSSGEQ